MSDAPINLNRARKARARDEKRRQADQNAIKFGRSKAERDLATARNKADTTRFDAHRREGDDDT